MEWRANSGRGAAGERRAGANREARLAIVVTGADGAIWLGETRLIDNLYCDLDPLSTEECSISSSLSSEAFAGGAQVSIRTPDVNVW